MDSDRTSNGVEARIMNRRWMTVFLIVGIILYSVVFLSVRPPDVGPDTPGSSASAMPDGSLAFAQLWNRLGYGFSTFAQLPEVLPADTKATFVVVEPSSDSYQEAELSALKQWVSEGHTVLWASADGCPLLPHVSLTTSNLQLVHAIDLRGQGVLLQKWSGLNFQPDAAIAGTDFQTVQTVYQANGFILGFSEKMGHGHIIYWASPSVFENQRIGDADNFQIAWNLVGQKPVLWDEFTHGQVSQSMLGAMFGGDGRIALLFLCIFAVLYIWNGSVRFGNPIRALDERPRLGTDFAAAFAWHLRQRGRQSYFRDLLVQGIQRRLTVRLGLPADAGTSTIDQAIKSCAIPELLERYSTWKETLQNARTRGGRKRWYAATSGLLAIVNQPGKNKELEQRSNPS